jgi:hypothetical protein
VQRIRTISHRSGDDSDRPVDTRPGHAHEIGSNPQVATARADRRGTRTHRYFGGERLSEVSGLPDVATLPARVQRIVSEDEARALAHRLLIPGRRLPTVVLTIAGGHDEPFGDPEEIKDAVGDLADVVLMPTSDVSWAFSHEMPSATQVYGGAGRVYPTDHRWVSIPSLSRLRFAYSPQDRERITGQLINDALQAALSGGLLALRSGPSLRQRSGTVVGVIASRALISLDDGTPATAWEELTVPGVPLDRVLAKGQRVAGVYDPSSRRLDLRAQLRYLGADSTDAVHDAYGVGDIVLADVARVGADAVDLRVLPGLTVTVQRAAVTSNPNDTLSELFSVDEVVRCRVSATGPLRLRLDDIDDDELPRPALSLLPDGPPWLRLAERVREPAVTQPVLVPVQPRPQAIERPEPPKRPSPLDFARRRPGAVPALMPPTVADWTHAAHLTNELAAERATRNSLACELVELRARAAELQADLDRADRTIGQLKTRYRSADLARQLATKQLKALQGRVSGPAGPAFLDREAQFDYEVYCEWVSRISAAEKESKPLAQYTLGSDFLDSVEQIEGVSRSKILAVVVEVLTGQVQHLPGRDAHLLRTGDAGSPYVTRADGAMCWRVALQRDTAAARRLHYWRSRDGYEFSRVVLHDDYRP